MSVLTFLLFIAAVAFFVTGGAMAIKDGDYPALIGTVLAIVLTCWIYWG